MVQQLAEPNAPPTPEDRIEQLEGRLDRLELTLRLRGLLPTPEPEPTELERLREQFERWLDAAGEHHEFHGDWPDTLLWVLEEPGSYTLELEVTPAPEDREDGDYVAVNLTADALGEDQIHNLETVALDATSQKSLGELIKRCRAKMEELLANAPDDDECGEEEDDGLHLP
jgi:hypothetical protein